MLGDGVYPITIAEMQNYSRDADQYFEFEEHEALKRSWLFILKAAMYCQAQAVFAF
jgi:hypothetical protein